MAQFDLYVDTYSGQLVSGVNNPASATFPRLVQGDTVSFRIYLLARTTGHPISTTPYTIIDISEISLKVAIGPKTGTAGSAMLTQQYTWAKFISFGTVPTYFYGDLPLNTAAITSAIGSGETTTSWFEIEYTQNGYPTTVFQQQVTIHAEVVESGALSVPAGETGLSVEVANATYLQKSNTGFVLVCPDDPAVKGYVYLAADGSFHCDPIT